MEASIQWMRAAVAAALIIFIAASSSQAVVMWDETVNGDLSSTRTSPTVLTVAVGDNLLSATSAGSTASSDREFFRFNVPVDHEFSGLVLNSFSGTDGTAFIGVQAGTLITSTASAAALLGYAHFGPEPDNVGDDILPEMGMGDGAIGFIPPLGPGDYAFWIQQANAAAPSTYEFNFQITALPPPEVLIGDYNGDNKVSAADYTEWRDHYGAPTLTNRDPDNEGPVGDDDFESWKEHYGEVPEGSGAGAVSIPEPSGVVLAFLATIFLGAGRLRWRS